MKTLRACLARLSGLFHRESRDRDFSEELASHVALHTDDNLRSGMTHAFAWEEPSRSKRPCGNSADFQ